jgi:hypothetical protein
MADESAEITLNENTNASFALVQPFKVESATSSDSKSAETIEVKPLSQTLELKPLSQTSSETIDLRPVKVDSRQEVAYTDPIRTDASSTVDLKPVALDICVRTGQASLPPTHVCEPYHHQISLTVLGMELFGVAWSGDQQTIVDNRPRQPMLAWGEVRPAPPPQRVGLPQHGPPHKHHHGGGHQGHGLRIRLTD